LISLMTCRRFSPGPLLPAALCLLLSGPFPAQSPRRSSPTQSLGSAFKLISVKVSGSQRYSAEAIAAAGGLEIGRTVNEDDFKRATQRLGETGAFTDVAYAYRYSAQGAQLELQVSDTEKLVPVAFDNLVWFSDAELLAYLRQRVPLFQGRLPATGSLPDQVSDALQAWLIEHQVQGRVDYLRSTTGDGPVEAFLFSVAGRRILVHDTVFTGAGAEELPWLQAAARKLQGQAYLRSVLRLQADKNLLPVYLARGYLKVSFADAQAKVVQESPQETDVDVTFAVDAGPQYRVSEVQWSGAKALPPEQLRELIHQQNGKPANAIELEEDLRAAQKVYGTRGYMAVSIRAKPQLDDAGSTVAYQIEVLEGELYHMGELEIQLPDSRLKSLVLSKWTLRAGDVYDSGYVQRFLDESFKSIPLLRDWNVNLHESPEPRDKTVDITLRFELKSSR
jgi:outer membrane protein assembly factor BamA